MNVAIIGNGRFGGSLAPLLQRAGVPADVHGRADAVPQDATVYVLAVRDGQLADAAARVPDGAVALHASGVTAADALGPRVRGGVLHPLMTFPGPEHGLPTLTGVGARVGGHPDAVSAALFLAGRLGMTPLRLAVDAPGTDTHGTAARYHAAACLVSGQLGAVLLVAADQLAAASGLSTAEARQALLPLARASLEAVAAGGASAATGPAVRGDAATIAAHRATLPDAALRVYDPLVEALRAQLDAALPHR